MAVTLLSSINGGTKKISLNNGYPLKSITETIINGFFTMDRNWTVKYWNKAAEKLLGVPAEDIVGKNLWEKFAGIIPIEFYMVYPKAFLLELPFHFEEYWGEMGAWFDIIVYHCDDTLSVSFKNSNYPVAPSHPDQPEQRLKIQNELYRFVAEVSNDCLWEWNLHTNEIFWIDGGHKKAFGYDIENAFIPRNFWESRIHRDDKDRILTGLNKVVTDGTSCEWADDYRFQKADGGYAYVHDRGYIIYDEDKNASRMIGTTLDTTAAKLNEIKLAETGKKLLQMEYWLNVQGQLLADKKIDWEQRIADGITTTEKSLPKDSEVSFPMPGTKKYPGSILSPGLVHDVRNALGAINLSLEMLESIIKDNDLKIILDIMMRSSIRIDHLMNGS